MQDLSWICVPFFSIREDCGLQLGKVGGGAKSLLAWLKIVLRTEWILFVSLIKASLSDQSLIEGWMKLGNMSR